MSTRPNDGAQTSGSLLITVPAGGGTLTVRAALRGGDGGQAGANLIVTQITSGDRLAVAGRLQLVPRPTHAVPSHPGRIDRLRARCDARGMEIRSLDDWPTPARTQAYPRRSEPPGRIDRLRARCDARGMEIRSLDDFHAAVDAECLIVITDSANPNKVHRPDCSFVTADNFAAKVLEGKARNGHYYVVGSVARASSLHGAAPCQVCDPS